MAGADPRVFFAAFEDGASEVSCLEVHVGFGRNCLSLILGFREILFLDTFQNSLRTTVAKISASVG